MQKVITGNRAISLALKLERVVVMVAYPITLQTSDVEELSEMCALRELGGERFLQLERP